MADSFDESALERARRDSTTLRKRLWFRALRLLFAAAIAAVQAVVVPTVPVAKALLAIICVLVTSLLANLIAFATLLFVAPIRQRDEARAELRRPQVPIDFDVTLHEDNDTVLVAVHNKGPAATFEASVRDITGAGKAVPVPWPVKWRDHPGRTCPIASGDTELLRLVHYTGLSNFAFATPTTEVRVGDTFFLGRQLNVRIRVGSLEPRVEKEWTLQMRYETAGYKSGFSLRLVGPQTRRTLPPRAG